MNWTLTEPRGGDIIRVKAGSLYHYGIYVSDTEIIQFGANPASGEWALGADVRVISTDIDAFLLGGWLEVAVCDKKESKKKNPPVKIISLARSRIGEGNYHILYNNCEHFVNECTFGEHNSSQVDKVRGLFRQMPRLDVYVANVPEKISPEQIYPPSRREEILSCKNERVAREKYAVWRLLEEAARNSFGLEIEKITFEKQKNGKWVCDKFCFSLTHGNGLAAVAVSYKPVGIDIESVNRVHLKIAERVLSKDELSELEKSEDGELYLAQKWTQKESEFKRSDAEVFTPAKISSEASKSILLEYFGERHVLSVSSENIGKLRLCQMPDGMKQI